MTVDAFWLGTIVGMVVFALCMAFAWILDRSRRRRAKRTFLRSRDGSIVQLYGPYRRRR